MELFSEPSLLKQGGIVLWLIAALSVVGLALILWIAVRLVALSGRSRAAAEAAVAAFEAGGNARVTASGIHARVVGHTIARLQDPAMSREDTREDAERVARKELAEARRGLRLLDIIATVAPLLGLLGTVLGMIAAFQALQESGAQADPSVLAGGIWEALLTTAAGMAVAIPAALAHAWFDGAIDRIALDLEDMLTRLFVARPQKVAQAAE